MIYKTHVGSEISRLTPNKIYNHTAVVLNESGSKFKLGSVDVEIVAVESGSHEIAIAVVVGTHAHHAWGRIVASAISIGI